MTAKEFLDIHFTEPDDLVNGDFKEIFERKMQEYANVKLLEIEKWLMTNTNLPVEKIVYLKVKFKDA